MQNNTDRNSSTILKQQVNSYLHGLSMEHWALIIRDADAASASLLLIQDDHVKIRMLVRQLKYLITEHNEQLDANRRTGWRPYWVKNAGKWYSDTALEVNALKRVKGIAIRRERELKYEVD
jgi:hypothetical protein